MGTYNKPQESDWLIAFNGMKLQADSLGVEWNYAVHDFLSHQADCTAAKAQYIRGLERILHPQSDPLDLPVATRRHAITPTIERCMARMALDAKIMIEQDTELKHLRWKLQRANEKLAKRRTPKT